MQEMVDMALVDGSLGRDEHKLLIQAGDQFGFESGEIDHLIRDRRKALRASMGADGISAPQDESLTAIQLRHH